MTVAGISNREFSRRENCSETLVRKAKIAGNLPSLPDGKLDPALVGTAWRPGANSAHHGSQSAHPAPVANPAVRAEPDETLEQAAERLTPQLLTQFKTKADAEVVKETYLALLRKLEYDEKSGEVVKVSDVARIVGAQLARVRSKLMAIPSSVAPMAALIKSPEEVRALIERAVAHALEELAYDDKLGADA